MFAKIKIIILLISILMGIVFTNVHIQCKQNSTETGPSNFSTSIQYRINYNFFAKYTFGNRKQSGLKICHWNAGSSYLVNKINEIETVVSNHEPHIFGISETSFHSFHSIEDAKIGGYQIYFAKTLQNPNLNASRVSVLIHNDIQSKIREDLMSDKFSSIWVEIGHHNSKKILVCNLYREWRYLNQQNDESRSKQAQYERWQIFISQWEKALNENKEVVVLGDVNLDFLIWGNGNDSYDQLSQLIFDRIFPHGVVQCIKEATHYWPNREPSGLDHLYTNHPEKLFHPMVINNGGSDHRMVMCTRHTKKKIACQRIIVKRSYKNFDANIFLHYVKKLPMWQVYRCEDPGIAVEVLSQFLSCILDTVAPVRKFQVRKNYCPWLTNETKWLISDRNAAQKKAAETKNPYDWKQFKFLRNKVTSRLKAEKDAWQKRKLSMGYENSSTMWKSIKGWLGWTIGGPPKQLFDGFKMCNKPSELSSIMNNHFVNKVKKIRNELPHSPADPLSLTKSLMRNKSCSFQLQAVHPDTILKIITSLRNTKSCGVDNIDSSVLKLAKFELAPAITHIVNLSISTCSFPQQWKVAKVIPLHKKESEVLPENYRPVALLSVLSKILEKAVFQQVSEYLEQNSILHESHHGFRGHHSTCTALLELYDRWLSAISRNETVAAIMVDLSAAFDVVDHGLLLEKLSVYGFDSQTINWFQSYLVGRSQVVLVDGHLSDPLFLEAGVPQGSILGPLLYILFTNDLPNIFNQDFSESKKGSVVCYADDSTLSLHDKDSLVLKSLVDEKYKEVAEYMAINKLKLNTSKTHLIILRTKEAHRRDGSSGVELNTGNEIIKPSECEKLLGVIVSKDLKWEQHIRLHKNSAIRVLTQRLNALSRISKFTSFKTRKMVAEGIFNSSLIYMIQLWGGSSLNLTSCLQIIQNKAARVVTKLGMRTPVKTLMQQIGWLSVRQLVVYHNCLTVYKIKKFSKPAYFFKKFGMEVDHGNEQPVSSRTRLYSTGGIRMENISMKSNLDKENFSWTSVSSWNNLPIEIRKLDSLCTFKRSLREWIGSNISVN